MRPRTLQAIYCCLWILLALSMPCRAREEKDHGVGTIVALRGEATATDSQGRTRPLAVKSPLYRHDTLQTGSRCRLQILFKDNSIISLGGDTSLKIAEYQWDPEKGKAVMTTEIKEGVFRVMGGLISRKDPEKIITKTPPATIGIRGSMYAGQVSGAGLTILFEGGKGILLTNATGTVLISKAGYGSTVRDWQTAIALPSRFDSQAIRSLQSGFAGKASLSSMRRDGQAASPGKRKLAPAAAASGGSISASPGRPGQQAGAARELPNSEQEQLQALSEAAKEDPELTAQLLWNAVIQDQVRVEKALEAILLGMRQADRQAFDRLVNESLELGLTVEQAREIAARLRAKGGGCP